MTIKSDVHLSGKFLFYKDGVLISETSNVITNGGMQRLAGHIYRWSGGELIADISRLFLGSDPTTEQYTDTGLGLTRYSKYNQVNMPDITTTKFSRTVDDRLKAEYIVATQCTITAPFTVEEVGMGQSVYDGSPATNPAYSIFCRSRPIAPIPVVIGDIIVVIYVLTVIVPDTVQASMDFDATTSIACVQIPTTSYSIRNFPFYAMKPDRSSYTYNNSYSYATPVFEFRTYYSNGDNYDGYAMQLFTGSIPGVTWNTMTPTMSTNYSTGYLKNQSVSNIPGSVIKKSAQVLNHVSPDGNTFTKIIRFLFNPGTWPVNATAFKFDPGYLTTNYCFSNDTNNSKTGFLALISNPYNPYQFSPDMFVGLDYTFNFTRD